MKSHFKARKQKKTYCPTCGKEVYILADDESQNSPKFLICFDCKFIGHIGIGEVQVK